MDTFHVGYTTTVDQVKQRQSVPNGHGEKRCYEHPGATLSTLSALTDMTRKANDQDVAKRARREPVHPPRLEASRIEPAHTAVSISSSKLCDAAPQAGAPAPGRSQHPLLSLTHPRYGLPDALIRNLASLGVNGIYTWQSSCLLGRGLLSGERNLVYTAPTGGGKSLVADVLMLKKIIEDASKKAILVLPYVALVQEKLAYLRKVVDGVSKQTRDPELQTTQLPAWRSPHVDSIRIVGFFGDSKARVRWPDFDLAICTIEKANALINTAIEEGSIHDLGIIVLDELHMIDDEHRGYLLELIASKILTLERHVQLVGMSATLTNTEILAEWMNAKFYSTGYVPVPMEEFLVYDRSIYATATSSAFLKTASQLNSQTLSASTPVRSIQMSKHPQLKNPTLDAVVALAVETAAANYGALVFCGGRQACQNTAMTISDAMPLVTNDEILDRRRDVMSELRSLSIGLDEVLGHTLIRGVAYHHAGLTGEERRIIADAYDKGILRVIVATCSLAAGINLPARRVILYGARMGRELIAPAMLRQMRGRAGRKGKDEIGESYLCCQKADLDDVVQLLEADLPPVQSSLTADKRGIKRALLEVITIRLATHMTTVQEYLQRTLLFQMVAREKLEEMVTAALEELTGSGLIAIDKYGGYEATRLSQAIVASHLTPDDGIFLHGELTKALQAFVMDGEMHVFYTLTPITVSGAIDINWQVFRREIDGLDDSGLRVLELVGVNPAFVNRMANSSVPLPETTPDEIRFARLYRRFYTALQLRDLSNEQPIHAVARKYQVSRGSVQTLAQTCEGFASGVIRFCDRMGWVMLRAALDHMVDRLKAGARADLLELAKIPFVKSRTARIFWENGIKSLRAVSEAEARDLVPVLELAQPTAKRLRLSPDDEVKYRRRLLLKAEIIVNAANRLWEQEQRQQILDVEADL